MRAKLVGVTDKVLHYVALLVWCPGCQYIDPTDGHLGGGLHMLPVNIGRPGGEIPRATWGWNGNLIDVTLTPSILTKFTRGENSKHVCHSFLTDGVWNFLADCTHELANKQIPMVDLPDWVL